MGGMAVADDLMCIRSRAPCLNSEIRFDRLRYRFADFFITSSVHFAMRAATIIPVLAVTVANGLSNQPGPPGVRIDDVCLVSPDGDFTRLAQRRREDGMEVSGFGERGPPRRSATPATGSSMSRSSWKPKRRDSREVWNRPTRWQRRMRCRARPRT